MSTFISPDRDYRFSDARLIEIALEKIAFAERDATELATVGITPVWVTDLENQVLAFGAMPTDTIELGEQKEATEEKEADADLLIDKLKELRSAAKRALGEKSVAFDTFGFKGLDKFKDSDLLKIALVIPALTTKHAVVLATKGWLAADNTELQTMFTDFVGGIQNQAMETGSRDIATDDRIAEGNEVYNLLENELCEAAKSYWRTRSAAKYNDYIIYNTGSGTSGINIVREAELTGAMPVNIPIADIIFTSHTRVLIEITNNAQQAYAGATPAAVYNMGDPLLDLAIGNEDLTAAEFAAATGLGTVGDFLMVRLVGVGPGHFKITFTNVAE